jgi:hypothetical protein
MPYNYLQFFWFWRHVMYKMLDITGPWLWIVEQLITSIDLLLIIYFCRRGLAKAVIPYSAPIFSSIKNKREIAILKTILILDVISGQADAQRETLLKPTSVIVNVDYTMQRLQGSLHVYIPCLCYSVDEVSIIHGYIISIEWYIPSIKTSSCWILIILHVSNVYFFCILQFGDDEDEVATLSKHHL